MFTTLYHQQFDIFDWGSVTHRPLAKYMLSYHPSLYNPDPNIFQVRTEESTTCKVEDSPVIFRREDGKISKIMVHHSHMDDLSSFNFSKEEIIKIRKKLNFINGWAYLNEGEFNLNKNPENELLYRKELRAKKIEENIALIRSFPEWMKMEEQKAKDAKIAIDEMIRMDAEYMLEGMLKNKKK